MNVGDYVRTKNGISKIVAFYSNAIFNDKNKRIENNLIIKSSPNIIDLIEVGDFIKYNPVQNHYAKKITLYKAIKDEKDLFFLKYQVQNDKLKILSIVTKEQFESMEYKL